MWMRCRSSVGLAMLWYILYTSSRIFFVGNIFSLSFNSTDGVMTHNRGLRGVNDGKILLQLNSHFIASSMYFAAFARWERGRIWRQAWDDPIPSSRWEFSALCCCSCQPMVMLSMKGASSLGCFWSSSPTRSSERCSQPEPSGPGRLKRIAAVRDTPTQIENCAWALPFGTGSRCPSWGQCRQPASDCCAPSGTTTNKILILLSSHPQSAYNLGLLIDVLTFVGDAELNW